METTQNTPGYLAAITDNGRGGDYGLGWKIAKAESEIRADINKVGYELSKSIGDAECHVAKEVGDAECAILTKLGSAESSIIKNDNDIAHRNTIALNSVERDLQNRIHENRQILTKEIGDKVNSSTEILRSQLNSFERSNAEKICKLETEGLKNTQLILSALDKNKYDALKDELDETRLQKYYDKNAYQFGLQNQEITSLKNMINSVEQTQRFSSKTVQFGAGNVAIPTQTANQG